MPRLKAQLLFPSKRPLLSDALWSEIEDDYLPLMPDIQAADSELEVWKHKLQANVETDNLCTLLEHSDIMFPNVHSILKILLTMPVSTATAVSAAYVGRRPTFN